MRRVFEYEKDFVVTGINELSGTRTNISAQHSPNNC